MGKRIGELEELTEFTGEESVPAVINGNNFRFKLKHISKAVSKVDLGIDKVDNTPDSQKPVSIAVASALNQKAERLHNHTPSDITGLDQHISDTVNGMNLGDVTVSNLEW